MSDEREIRTPEGILRHPNWDKRTKMVKLSEMCRYNLRNARGERANIALAEAVGVRAYEHEEWLADDLELATRACAAIRVLHAEVTNSTYWSGSPDPDDPANFWIDDDTGERVCAVCGHREPR